MNPSSVISTRISNKDWPFNDANKGAEHIALFICLLVQCSCFLYIHDLKKLRPIKTSGKNNFATITRDSLPEVIVIFGN